MNLAAAIDTAAERLPGSPGETYLAGRGVPLNVDQALRIGWATGGKLAGRVVFPLCGPDGLATSAIGRAANDHTKPKYKALASDDGYVKTLFNGGAIAPPPSSRDRSTRRRALRPTCPSRSPSAGRRTATPSTSPAWPR